MNTLRSTVFRGPMSGVVWAPDDGAGGGGSSSVAAPAPSDGGGGGASTPSSAPTDSPVTSSPSTPSDWSNIGSTDDLDHLEIQESAEPTPPPAPPAEVPPAPPAQPVPEQAPPPPPQAATEGQPQPGAAKPLTAADPWRIAEGLEANRNEVIAHLAQAKFALSEEDIRELDADVTVAVPKLLARAFLESQIASQKFLAQAVPAMIKQYNTVTGANESAEKQFFTAHPSLNVNDPTHRATAVRIATIYRQANPNIPLPQLIQEVGPMVMAALQVKAQAAPARPGQPVLPRGGVPFRPAVNGGGGSSPATEPPNEWAGLGQTYD